MWLVGDAHAVRLSPIEVTADGLAIARGARWRAFVRWDELADATAIGGRAPGALDLTLFGPNVLLALPAPVIARGPLGLTRAMTRLTVSVDERDAFLAQVAARRG